MSGVLQGFILGPLLFNVFINDTNNKMQCTLRKCADDTKRSGAADTPRGLDAIQRDLGKLEKWACLNLMRISKARCKVLHVGQGNPHYRHRLGHEWIKGSPAKTEFKVLVEEKLDMSTEMYIRSAEGQPYPGLHQTKCGQQDEGGDLLLTAFHN